MGTPKKSTVWPHIYNEARDVLQDIEGLIHKTPTSEVRNFLCDAQICINEAIRLADIKARG